MIDHAAKPLAPQEVAPPNRPALKADETETQALEAALPGYSVRPALARLRHNPVVYRTLLASYVDQHRNSSEALLDLLQHDDRTALFQIAHGLKGVAGNLGIDAVFAAADAVANLLRNGLTGAADPRLPALTEALAARCAESVALLAGFVASGAASPVEHEAPAKQEIDIASLRPLLAQLARQLEIRSFGARTLAREVAAQLDGTPLAADFAEIDRSTAALRYDVALSNLRELIEHLPKP